MLGIEKKISPSIANEGLSYTAGKLNEQYLMDELKKLDEAYKAVKEDRLDNYKASLPSSLNLNKMSFAGETDEELKAQAETYLIDNYETDKNKLIEEIDANKLLINKNKNTLTKAQQDTLDNLDTAYAVIKENINNQTLKKGIGRSSIKSNIIIDADSNKSKQTDEIINDTKQSLTELDNEITALEKKKQDSLKAFDLSYASEVQTKLDKLIAERDKKINDALEYNNRIAKQEADYQSERTEQIEDYKDKLKKEDIADEEYFSENGYKPTMQDEYEARYAMAYDFYMKLPSDSAKRVLNENSELEKYLGSKYYNKLKTIIVMRK